MKNNILSILLIITLLLAIVPVPVQAQGQQFDGDTVFLSPDEMEIDRNTETNQAFTGSAFTRTYFAYSDTFISEGYPDENFDDYFLYNLNVLLIGEHASTGHQRALLKYDLSSIPSRSIILSAELRINMVAYWKPFTETEITGYRITSDWQSATTTWNNAPDFKDSFGPADHTSYYWDVASLTQDWIDGKYPNYGMMLKGEETSTQDLKAFASSENCEYNPYLVVTYIPPGNEHSQTSLKQKWSMGTINLGLAALVEDLDRDGTNEIISGTSEHAYALNYDNNGNYIIKWYSERTQATSLAVGDANKDGISEIYVGTGNSEIRIFTGDTFKELPSIQVENGQSIKTIKVADVDDDKEEEVIALTTASTLIYDAARLNLKWQAEGKGGNDLEVGDIDGDLQPEIVVNANPAHILDAKNHIEKWTYEAGFGEEMSLGDVDNDKLDEIVYQTSSNTTDIFDADILTTKLSLPKIGATAVNDVDGDGYAEVVIGSSFHGFITGFRGTDGVQLWEIPDPAYDMTVLSAGDTNNDGVREIIWGSELWHNSPRIFIGSWITGSVLWVSEDLHGISHVAAGDIDLDGQEEIVSASYGILNYRMRPCIAVYDAYTQTVEWSVKLNEDEDVGEVDLLIGQFDSDATPEIFLYEHNLYGSKAQITVYDGLTKIIERQENSEINPDQIFMSDDIDNDNIDEIFLVFNIHNAPYHIQVLSGENMSTEWDSGTLDSQINDLAVSDLEDDGITEIAILTNKSIYIYQVGTWLLKAQIPFEYGQCLAITDDGLSGDAELLITHYENQSSEIANKRNTKLLALNAKDYSRVWQYIFDNMLIYDLNTDFLDGDQDQEVLIMGKNTYGPSPKVVTIASIIDSTLWRKFEAPSNWPAATDISFFKDPRNERTEAIACNSSAFEIYDVGEWNLCTLSSTEKSTLSGSPVTFTASINTRNFGSKKPSGTITFRDGTKKLEMVDFNYEISNSVSIVVDNLTTGPHMITAEYSGDQNYIPSTSEVLFQTVEPSSITVLSSTPNPVLFGQQITFTAVVKPAKETTLEPTGQVSFKDGTLPLGTAELNEEETFDASFCLADLSPGKHTIIAEYQGDDNFSASTSEEMVQIVNPNNSISLSSSLEKSTLGQPVTFQASIISHTDQELIPTGTITFNDSNIPMGTVKLSNEQPYSGSLTLADLPLGKHTITAEYSGDKHFNAATSTPVSQSVFPATLCITTGSLNNGNVKANYTQTIHTLNGTAPCKWSVLNKKQLPPGLKLKVSKDTLSATIYGRPTKTGIYTFTVRVVNSNKYEFEKEYSIGVNPAIVISAEKPIHASIGVYYELTPIITGGSGYYECVITKKYLPPGMVLDKNTGIISGKPTTPGAYGFCMSVNDILGGTAKKQMSIIVNQDLYVKTTSLNQASVGKGYKMTLKAAGGDRQYTWSLAKGSDQLPKWVDLPQFFYKGVITNIPEQKPNGVKVYRFQFWVQDGLGDSAISQVLELSVK